MRRTILWVVIAIPLTLILIGGGAALSMPAVRHLIAGFMPAKTAVADKVERSARTTVKKPGNGMPGYDSPDNGSVWATYIPLGVSNADHYTAARQRD
jgi:hypothetical protein